MFEKKFREFMLNRTFYDSAHDIAHVERVVLNAKNFAITENADLDIVVPAAWLHDCVTVNKDSPLRSKASLMAAEKARELLDQLAYNEVEIKNICHAIEAHSYSADITPTTLEAKIVQDADRIDALGAIGVARCFLVGGSINTTVYNPIDPFCDDRDPDDSKFCIDHFLVKLFKITDTLHTESAILEAESRVQFMKSFLIQLKIEIHS